MADITALENRYYVQSSDVSGSDGNVVPHTSAGNRITYLIDGNQYFGAIRQEIVTLLAGGTNRYFYFTEWWLGLVQGPVTSVTTDPGSVRSAWAGNLDLSTLPPFDLNDGSPGPFTPLIDQLEKMVTQGIDVRIFPWVAPFLVNNEEVAKDSKLEGYWVVNVHTLYSTVEMRKRARLADRIVLNTLAHTLGAMHLKMVVCGDDSRMVAYVSGLDFVENRVADWRHSSGKKWHDAGVKIEGPAATGPYDYLRLLWNEQLQDGMQSFKIAGNKIVTQTDNAKPILARSTPALGAPGPHHVQVLRTAPQMNFSTFYNDRIPVPCLKQIFMRLFLGFKSDKLDFAEHGIFEFRAALHKAITNAQQYIYIEDQSFYAIEAMQWINNRLKDNTKPPLKVILLYGADPSDPPSSFIAEAIRQLIDGVPDVNDHVVFYQRGDGVVVHSKLTIVDDKWAVVGSANFMRRSFYTDGECSIAVLDENTPSFAQLLRKDLWGEHCQRAPDAENPAHPRDAVLNLDQGLRLWHPGWGSPGPASLRPELQRMRLPFEYATPPTPGQWPGTAIPFDPQTYEFGDADSREEY